MGAGIQESFLPSEGAALEEVVISDNSIFLLNALNALEKAFSELEGEIKGEIGDFEQPINSFEGVDQSPEQLDKLIGNYNELDINDHNDNQDHQDAGGNETESTRDIPTTLSESSTLELRVSLDKADNEPENEELLSANPDKLDEISSNPESPNEMGEGIDRTNDNAQKIGGEQESDHGQGLESEEVDHNLSHAEENNPQQSEQEGKELSSNAELTDAMYAATDLTQLEKLQGAALAVANTVKEVISDVNHQPDKKLISLVEGRLKRMEKRIKNIKENVVDDIQEIELLEAIIGIIEEAGEYIDVTITQEEMELEVDRRDKYSTLAGLKIQNALPDADNPSIIANPQQDGTFLANIKLKDISVESQPKLEYNKVAEELKKSFKEGKSMPSEVRGR